MDESEICAKPNTPVLEGTFDVDKFLSRTIEAGKDHGSFNFGLLSHLLPSKSVVSKDGVSHVKIVDASVTVRDQIHQSTDEEKPKTINENAALAQDNCPKEEDDSDESDYDENYSDEDYDEENDEHVIGNCLHCHLPPPSADGTVTPHTTAPGIQVSCDECHAFICSACHWCHEFQANHEIRVCDRCDAFYCKGCDEMDQCEDCGEVVCSGCCSLASCKFCGCGLCEECATACGRCGIVLCSRDAKFAVECDTCKMPYCLVCLASGAKDPCVRCGCRTSKRVEQLVHLRLKSIYKAFKQSGAALGIKAGFEEKKERILGKDMNQRSNVNISREMHVEDNVPLVAKRTAHGTTLSIPLPASLAKYAKSHVKDPDSKGCILNSEAFIRKEDIGVVLQAAAAAAASAVHAHNTLSDSGNLDDLAKVSSFGKRRKDSFDACRLKARTSSMVPHHNNNPPPSQQCIPVDESKARNGPRTLAEADAAAAALLAELDEEKMQNEANHKAKKEKKKKKKEKQLASTKSRNKLPSEQTDDKFSSASPLSENVTSYNDNTETLTLVFPPADLKNNEVHDFLQYDDNSKMVNTQHEASSIENNDYEVKKLSGRGENPSELLMNLSIESFPGSDEVEMKLSRMVEAHDLHGIESILFELKGIPGRAALRKNAKKAMKRIVDMKSSLDMGNIETAIDTRRKDTTQPVVSSSLPTSSMKTSPLLNKKNLLASSADVTSESRDNATAIKCPEPLLKIVSQNHRSNVNGATTGSSSVHRSDCVLHMNPAVVGWVIGRGGQRIRDLMEESGAKLWIDQDSMGPKDMRVVYVSGSRKSVEAAVKMVKDLVAKAPVGIGPCISTNDSSNVRSDRFVLSSTQFALGNDTISANTISGSLPVASGKQHMLPGLLDDKVPTPITRENGDLASSTVHPQQTSFVSIDIPTNNIVASMHPELSLDLVGSHASCISQELTCEARFVPLLIGRRGWTVKHIQDTSGARVDIDQTVTPRRIIISGDHSQVEHAMQLVRDVLSYPHVQLQSSEDITNDESFSTSLVDEIINGKSHSGEKTHTSTLVFDTKNDADGLNLQNPTQGLPPSVCLARGAPVSFQSFVPQQAHLIQSLTAAPPGIVATRNEAFPTLYNHSFQNDSRFYQHSSLDSSLEPKPFYPEIACSGRNTYSMPPQIGVLYNSSEQLLGPVDTSYITRQPNFPQSNVLLSTFPAAGREIFTESLLSEKFVQDRTSHAHAFENDFGLGNTASAMSDQYSSSISSELLNPAASQYVLPGQCHVVNDSDIDGMFGPVSYPVYGMDNSNPLLSGFSAISLDNVVSSERVSQEMDWGWNSSVPKDGISGIFSSKSRRSSADHSIGLGGVKLDA